MKHQAEAEIIPNATPPGDADMLSKAESLLRESLASLKLPFKQPELELLGIIAYQGPSSQNQKG
jgi:hypothetical protein